MDILENECGVSKKFGVRENLESGDSALSETPHSELSEAPHSSSYAAETASFLAVAKDSEPPIRMP